MSDSERVAFRDWLGTLRGEEFIVAPRHRVELIVDGFAIWVTDTGVLKAAAPGWVEVLEGPWSWPADTDGGRLREPGAPRITHIPSWRAAVHREPPDPGDSPLVRVDQIRPHRYEFAQGDERRSVLAGFSATLNEWVFISETVRTVAVD